MKTIAASAVRSWVPRRSRTDNKGDNGRILIIAGSSTLTGAPVLTALGALRSGAGLVRVLVPKNARGVVARRLPLEAMSEDLPMGNTLLLKRVNAFHPDVIAIGPGLGTEPRTARLVHVLLKESRIPIVLDADGLNVFKKAPRALADRRAPLIITPHPGELSRLLGTSISWINRQRASAVTLAARRFNGVCLLKGDATLVSDGVRIWKNPTGNPGMGSGGMGDVLTGVTAALWAQRIKRGHTNGLEAAALAAYVHGRAGDLAAKKISKIGFLASDLADFLPRSLAHL